MYNKTIKHKTLKNTTMKNLILLSILGLGIFASCEKAELVAPVEEVKIDSTNIVVEEWLQTDTITIIVEL